MDVYRDVEVLIYTGPNRINPIVKEKDKYVKMANDLTYFDDYKGEKCFIIKEYNNQITTERLLQFISGEPLQVKDSNGKIIDAEWTKVIIITEDIHSFQDFNKIISIMVSRIKYFAPDGNKTYSILGNEF